MANNFRLSFSGLCAFVPNNEFNRMRVLLVDARNAHRTETHEHVPHFPVLIVEHERVASDSPRQRDDYYTKDGATYDIFFLDDRDLTISGAQANSLTILMGRDDDCPSDNDINNFEWVVPMEEVTPDSGEIIQECLEPGGHESVVARVALTEGTISINGFADEPPYIIKWKFEPAGGGTPSPHRRAIAEQAVLDYTFDGDIVELKATYFRNSKDPEIIRLEPKESDDGLRLFARVRNSPWPNIREEVEYFPPRKKDSHFEHFYDMSQAPGDRNIPWPLLDPADRCRIDPFPGPETPLCPPTRFNPNLKA